MRIEHVAMYVDNLENAKNFFVKYFDAKSSELYHNINTSFKSYFLTFKDGARIEIMNRHNIQKDCKSTIRTGLNHIAFSVGSKESVNKLTQQFEKDGYEIISYPRITGDGYYESCIVGIENIQIEITI